jgi:hypothetical protein
MVLRLSTIAFLSKPGTNPGNYEARLYCAVFSLVSSGETVFIHINRGSVYWNTGPINVSRWLQSLTGYSLLRGANIGGYLIADLALTIALKKVWKGIYADRTL